MRDLRSRTNAPHLTSVAVGILVFDPAGEDACAPSISVHLEVDQVTNGNAQKGAADFILAKRFLFHRDGTAEFEHRSAIKIYRLQQV